MWRRSRQERALATELVAECESFCLGRYADRLESRSLPVPVWAWTNLLAHGDEGDLRTELSGLLHGEGMPAMSHGEEWHAARTYLAAEVLDAAEQAGGLGSIQSSALVPLEMKLADRATAAGWSCRQWVEAVRAALAGRRPTQRS